MTLAARVRHVDSGVEHGVHEALVARPPQAVQLTIQVNLDDGGFDAGVHGGIASSEFWHSADCEAESGCPAEVFPMAGRQVVRRPVTGTLGSRRNGRTYRWRL